MPLRMATASDVGVTFYGDNGMSFTRREILVAGTAAAASIALCRNALAQAAPDMVRLFVGFPGGTTPDAHARKVGERLTKGYTRSANVENRLGAGGQLAVSAMKGAAADGSNVLLTPMSMLGVFPHTYKKLPYDPEADLTPVSMGATFEYGISVGPAVPDSVKDIRDLIAWFKANPTRANIASPSTGSTLHFVIVMLGRAAGVEITHIGYKGSSPAIADMLGGTMPALCAPLGTFFNQPKLRVVATSGAKRSRFTPNVPTLAEQGFKDLVFEEWYGFFLPAKASTDIVNRLNAALRSALAEKEVVDTLATFGLEPAPSSPEQLVAALRADDQKWRGIVKSIGFSADS